MWKLLAQTVNSLPRNPRVLRACVDPNSNKRNEDFENRLADCWPISPEASRHPALRTERPSWRASMASTVTASGLAEQRKFTALLKNRDVTAQLVVGDSKNTITLARSSADVSPPYGFMLLPGTTSSGFAMK